MSQLLLDVARVDAYATVRHGRLILKDRQRRAEPDDIGKVAEQLTRNYLRGNVGDESYARLKVARCAGLLVYALDAYGANFESVCDVAEYTVASLVSTITADNR